MFNEGDATKVLNRRIGSKLHHLYTLSVEKRGLVPYDDKRVLLADLPDGTPNPRTHAFGHYAIADEIQVEQPDQPEAGNDLVIEARAPRVSRNLKVRGRLQRKHKLAVRRARALHPDEINDDDPDLDSDEELTGDQLEAAQRAASARPGGAQRMEDVIQNILHRSSNRTTSESAAASTSTPARDAGGRVRRTLQHSMRTKSVVRRKAPRFVESDSDDV